MAVFYILIMRDFVFVLESTVRPKKDPCGFANEVKVEIKVKVAFKVPCGFAVRRA